MAEINVLTLTSTQAQQLLQQGKTTSVQLVEAYLAQIERHNHAGLRLNALINVAPRDKLLAAARELDAERATTENKQGRGPLHGVPFIVKDVFVTHADTGLPTTAGGVCFRTAKGRRDAPLLARLVGREGMLLLGKANLTEFCGLKMRPLSPGWSAAGGQTQSPYVFGGQDEAERVAGGGKFLPHSGPGGSSSGPAAGVAAGFAPLSIGTECAGSVVTPAGRNAVYALKMANGEVDDAGCFAYTDGIDAVGGMAKSAGDLVPFCRAMMDRPFGLDEIEGGFGGLKIGWLDPKTWRLPETACEWSEEMREHAETTFMDAVQKMTDCGGILDEYKGIPIDWTDMQSDDNKSFFYEIAMYQLQKTYLPAFIDEMSECEVRSFEDIIEYNKAHAEESMPPSHPSQHEYEELVKTERSAEQTKLYMDEMRRRGRKALDGAFVTHDVLIAFAESPICRYTSAAVSASDESLQRRIWTRRRFDCYPIACVPLGMVRYSVENERPFGLCIAAGKGKEGLLLRFMRAWEAAMPPRPLPRPLLAG